MSFLTYFQNYWLVILGNQVIQCTHDPGVAVPSGITETASRKVTIFKTQVSFQGKYFGYSAKAIFSDL